MSEGYDPAPDAKMNPRYSGVEPKFAVGDIVTRGRGRPTYRVKEWVTEGDRILYGVVNVNDGRNNPRVTTIAEDNLRKKES